MAKKKKRREIVIVSDCPTLEKLKMRREMLATELANAVDSYIEAMDAVLFDSDDSAHKPAIQRYIILRNTQAKVAALNLRIFLRENPTLLGDAFDE